MKFIQQIIDWILSLFTKGQLDPKHGVNTVATVFGSTYKGAVDPTDNGQGAFLDLATAKPYETRKVVGVSIPIPVFHETLSGSKLAVEERKFTVTIAYEGKWYKDLPIVDLGPGAFGRLLKDKEGRTHLLDRTYPLCRIMNSFDNAEIAYWIVDSKGNSVPIKGLEVGYVII